MLTWSSVRRLIDAHLPTDAELERFFQDHFRSVHRRLGQDMDRNEKINLLREHAQPDAVHAALAQMIPRLG